MSARDFINETLLPKLQRELADKARGNKHTWLDSKVRSKQ
jgi:hypothetical protein